MPTRIIFGAGLIALSLAYFSFMAEKRTDRFVDLAKAMGENIDLLPEKEKVLFFYPKWAGFPARYSCGSNEFYPYIT